MSDKAGSMIVTVVKANVPPNEKGPKQACVKVELRESAEIKQKQKTSMQTVDKDNTVEYGQKFNFNVVASYAGELRVQLFKKNESIMGGKAVVANAGIYVKNIVSHINQHGGIDKEFTLFTKDGKSAGGSVHLRIDFVPVDGATMVRQQSQSASAKEGLGVHNFTEDEAATKLQASFRGHMTAAIKAKKDNKKGPSSLVIGGLLLIVGAIAALSVKKSDAPPPPSPAGKKKK